MQQNYSDYTVKNILIENNREDIIFEYYDTDLKLKISSDIDGYGGKGTYYGNVVETLEETLSICIGNKIRLVDIGDFDDFQFAHNYREVGQQVYIHLSNYDTPLEIFMITDCWYAAYVTVNLI